MICASERKIDMADEIFVINVGGYIGNSICSELGMSRRKIKKLNIWRVSKMKILIIGNGFDLASGLPTRYSDFLNICKLANKTQVSWVNEPPYIIGTEDQNLKTFCEKVGAQKYYEFAKITRSCFWIDHFIERSKKIGGKWLDFEEEIKHVIKSLITDMESSDDGIVNKITNISLHNYCKNRNLLKDNFTFKELFSYVQEEQVRLTRALEIYMDSYVYNLEVTKIQEISSRKYDRLLSFNYTSTYTENYDATIDTCYIHGKADANINNTRMVLGYDDEQLDNLKQNPEGIIFEKYYQRIVKNTDSKYFYWLNEINREEKDEVTIYGHSLAPADGDVLKSFICSHNTKIIIYYLDEVDRADKIRNLAIILGRDKLIQLTTGVHKTINFVQIKR